MHPRSNRALTAITLQFCRRVWQYEAAREPTPSSSTRAMPSLTAMLTLLILLFATCGASAFLPITTRCRRVDAVSHQRHQLQNNDGYLLPNQHAHAQTVLRMGYKSPDEINSYNDDAFGFVFLTGGVLSQDVDFAATFASLSAIAAIGTRLEIFDKDERAPAAVAMATLLVSPVVTSLRQTGSLGNVVPPMSVEIGVCAISAAWAFFNWSKVEKE